MIDPEMAFQTLIAADPRFSEIEAVIYTQELPEGVTYPAICMWCLDDMPGQTFDGADGTVEQTWRFDLYSPDYDQVKILRRIVKDALLFGNDDLTDGGKKVTLDDGVLSIQSSIWRGGRSVSFDDANQHVHGWEVEIEFCVLEDAA